MPPLAKQQSTLLIAFAAVTIVFACAFLYLNHRQPPEANPLISAAPAGEPEAYAATIVRTLDDGATSAQSITGFARSGEMRREQWSERGASRAIIWRPDLGKYFLLDLDRREFVEQNINPVADSNPRPPATDSPATGGEPVSPEYIDRAFTDKTSPASLEIISLADQTIEGFTCQVIEQRGVFADGHTEITRSYHARELAGLVLRQECESSDSPVKVLTERRGIRIDVSPEEFAVPAGFRKVNRLAQL